MQIELPDNAAGWILWVPLQLVASVVQIVLYVVAAIAFIVVMATRRCWE